MRREWFSFFVLIAVAVGICLFYGSKAESAVTVATWYGPGFDGNKTASGETFNPRAFTAAHRHMPFGTVLRVTYGDRETLVRVNDRGPYGDADLDLSEAAADKIGLKKAGKDAVLVEPTSLPMAELPRTGGPGGR
jgi:rare lipoprotein A